MEAAPDKARRLAASPRSSGRALAAAAGPLVVALSSAALILGDIGRASAFVVATPWKLQADELATMRLFKDNIPSVVYITNLVVHMADCLGCAALDDGVLHKVEAAAYWTAVAPNIEEYGSVVARAITSGDENVAKGILWHGVMTVDMLPWGTSPIGVATHTLTIVLAGFGSRGLTVKSKVHVVLESCWEEDGY
ncbi:hypothetical protein ZWY2020_058634 [Hordeum vulgare]|nr:hypothetical protein ZWY2020_058634 [Hordeum vulgare]